ncbi:MAG: hypothetical protein APF80_05745 [Alphaproteobacteria bacterium BRH_c36]|nr:MAG: hypothetical protein APF80_05745 [Alphaproteobacteria bacterium BRH_c36]
MISTKRHQHERDTAGRFAIIAVSDSDAAPWTHTFDNMDVKGFSSRSGDGEGAQLQLLAFNQGYDAVFIAGFGAGAEDALQLAARFPDLISGIVLLTPQIRRAPIRCLAANVFAPTRAALQRLTSCIALKTGFEFNVTQPNPAPARLCLRDITQPVLIFHPRAGRNADIKVAATLQRRLGGPVEVQFIGPGADVEAFSPLNLALSRRCLDFTARVAAGAEGRRAKRQQSAANQAAPSASPLLTLMPSAVSG